MESRLVFHCEVDVSPLVIKIWKEICGILKNFSQFFSKTCDALDRSSDF